MFVTGSTGTAHERRHPSSKQFKEGGAIPPQEKKKEGWTETTPQTNRVSLRCEKNNVINNKTEKVSRGGGGAKTAVYGEKRKTKGIKDPARQTETQMVQGGREGERERKTRLREM